MLRKLFDSAFSESGASQPEARKWSKSLGEYALRESGKLVQCRKDRTHQYFAGHTCAACQRDEAIRRADKRPKTSTSKASRVVRRKPVTIQPPVRPVAQPPLPSPPPQQPTAIHTAAASAATGSTLATRQPIKGWSAPFYILTTLLMTSLTAMMGGYFGNRGEGPNYGMDWLLAHFEWSFVSIFLKGLPFALLAVLAAIVIDVFRQMPGRRFLHRLRNMFSRDPIAFCVLLVSIILYACLIAILAPVFGSFDWLGEERLFAVYGFLFPIYEGLDRLATGLFPSVFSTGFHWFLTSLSLSGLTCLCVLAYKHALSRDPRYLRGIAVSLIYFALFAVVIYLTQERGLHAI